MTQDTDTVNVRYMVDDVPAAVNFYTAHLGFSVLTNFGAAFADVKRGNLRLLLSGHTSSAGGIRSESAAVERYPYGDCRAATAVSVHLIGVSQPLRTKRRY